MTKAAEIPSDFPIKYSYLWTLKEFQNCGVLSQNCGVLSQNFYVHLPTSIVCQRVCHGLAGTTIPCPQTLQRFQVLVSDVL